ncbi:LOW QUALITY PROTEIN: hypothetical protein QYF61_003981 [Mycteria americana]|uniref:Uncharacterized protein n=1 Tax=Mycteria americana TaxID=33587 RepID=A0AAN7PBE6_MYCAM|nr:LOW QUALITY PROTEIN: hypothetical protein QYF61_003981 [Mycteria americana]
MGLTVTVYVEFSKALVMVAHSLLLENLMLDNWSRQVVHVVGGNWLTGRTQRVVEDLDRLEEWANKNLMQFNKDKGKVLHLGKHNPGVQHRLGSTQLGSSSVERDPGVLVDNQLNMSEQRAAVAKKANGMLGCTNEGITSRDKAAIIPLYSALATPGILSPLRKKDVDRLERVQGRATKMLKGLGNLPYEERLRELGLFSLEKRRLRGDLITMFQYLKGGYKEDGDSLFTRSHIEKTKGNGYKLLLGRSRLDTRGKFVTMRTISHWGNLPREVVDSPTLDAFKKQLDRALRYALLRWESTWFPSVTAPNERLQPCPEPLHQLGYDKIAAEYLSLKRPTEVQVCGLMVTAAKTAFDLHLPSQPFFVCAYEVQQSICLHRLPYQSIYPSGLLIIHKTFRWYTVSISRHCNQETWINWREPGEMNKDDGDLQRRVEFSSIDYALLCIDMTTSSKAAEVSTTALCYCTLLLLHSQRQYYYRDSTDQNERNC